MSLMKPLIEYQVPHRFSGGGRNEGAIKERGKLRVESRVGFAHHQMSNDFRNRGRQCPPYETIREPNTEVLGHPSEGI